MPVSRCPSWQRFGNGVQRRRKSMSEDHLALESNFDLIIASQIHRRVAVQGHALLHRALQALHAGSSPDFSAKQALGQVFAVNTLSVPRRELVRVSNINPSSFFTQKVKGSEDHLVLFETQPGGHVALPVMRPQLHGTKSDMGVKGTSPESDDCHVQRS